MQSHPFETLKWRFVGPYRGGRVMAVAGHPAHKQRFYFGSTGGGVFKTDNAGHTWANISDRYFKRATVGAITVAPSDPDVIYVGMGETGMTPYNTHGDGVYKSLDGGLSWRHLGLSATHNIGAIEVHPNNPDMVYVAAFGRRFGNNPERGVYMSIDGGARWELVCHVASNAGAVDLSLDRSDPNLIYAAFWPARQQPWGHSSGGPNSRIFRSQNGGASWQDITRNPGLPSQPLGKIGLAASPVQPGRVWALIEAGDGGVYRSDDAGDTWTWLNSDRNFLARPRFFTHIVADPQDADTVYLPLRKLWKSVDAGRSFAQLNVPYVDQHALWINPDDTDVMILGSDGGAAVSTNAGESWSTLLNQPTAEIYRVAVDSRFPYRIYGSQQDNSTLAIDSRSERGPISRMNWYDVGGGESGFIAVRPDDPDIVYSSDLPGLGVTRYNHKNLQIREIAPWAESVTEKLEASRYRFNWATPVVLSPHDPDILYVCGNHVFRTRNEGESWEVISPDLTRNDKSKLSITGGPISFTHRATDHYCTITSLSESPLQAGVIWVGTDDGLVHVSRDNGANWQNVTPADLPEWSEVQVEASRHSSGTAFITATAHKLDDFQPYLFMTDDAGQTWQRIDGALPRDEFLRVVREDLTRPGLLYAGTEAGFYLSPDCGGRWLPLQNNLPHVSVYDIALKERDIVIGTFGRGMWILDDIAPLQQWNENTASAAIHLFQPTNVYRLTRQIIRRDSLLELYEPFAARNPPAGITVYYWLKTAPDQPLILELLDADGTTIRRYDSGDEDPPKPAPLELGLRWGNITFVDDPPLKSLSAKPGLHRVEIPLSHPPAFKLPGMLTMGVTAPILVPGQYTIRMRCGEKQWTQPVHVHGDPRVATTLSEYQLQFDLMIAIRDSVSLIHQTVADMRSIVAQLDALIAEARQDEGESISQDSAQSLRRRLRDIENCLIQPKLTAASAEMDAMHFPPKLDHNLEELGYQVIRSDNAPTKQMIELYDVLRQRVDRHVASYHALLSRDLHELNRRIEGRSAPIAPVPDALADTDLYHD